MLIGINHTNWEIQGCKEDHKCMQIPDEEEIVFIVMFFSNKHT